MRWLWKWYERSLLRVTFTLAAPLQAYFTESVRPLLAHVPALSVYMSQAEEREVR